MSDEHPGRPERQAKEDAPPRPQRSRLPSLIVSFGNWLDSTANGIIAVFTIVMALTSWFMWRTTERSLDLTQESLELTRQSVDLTRKQVEMTNRLERAKVVVEEIGRISLSSSKRYDGVTVRVRNVGRVPAQAVEVMTRPTRPVELRLQTQMPCDRWSPSHMVASALAPGQETTFVTAPIKLTPEAANKIYQRRANLFLWFSTTYRDSFGEPETETSCYVVSGTADAIRQRPPTTPWR